MLRFWSENVLSLNIPEDLYIISLMKTDLQKYKLILYTSNKNPSDYEMWKMLNSYLLSTTLHLQLSSKGLWGAHNNKTSEVLSSLC